ncbi:hypothetical protein [Streptomyces sp. NPDC004528]|uniref:hypothetical protein n=1 Tax=Streptomyces sp. NPDC004528 TaxID=3154550 RepID=UPI0033AF87F1
MQNADGVYDRTKPWATLPEIQVSDTLAYLAAQAPACWKPPKPTTKTAKREPTIQDVLGMSNGGICG